VTQNLEKFRRRRFRRNLWAETVVHGKPIQLSQREKGIVLCERLPEDLIIRERGIGNRLPTARFRSGVGAAQQNIRDAAVSVEPASFWGRSRRDAEGIILSHKDDFTDRAHLYFASCLDYGYATQSCDLITTHIIFAEFDELPVSIGKP
jgi:hypothetical protein